MLEPENQLPKFQSEAFDSPIDERPGFSTRNRSSLSEAGGWALFVSIFLGLSLLFMLYALLVSLNNYTPIGSVLVILFSLLLIGALFYWLIRYYSSSKAIGRGSNDVAHVQQMSSSLLAFLRIWGISVLIGMVLYGVALVYVLSFSF